MMRVCHLSSAHRGLDVRIFYKECVSLAAAGYETHLVISANPQEVAGAYAMGVTVHPLKTPVSRFSRIFLHSWRAYQIGRSLEADIYHFHDPELIPFCILLAIDGKKVIYDVHEDLPRDISTKAWITPLVRKAVSGAMGAIEFIGARYFFSIAAATPFIANRFAKINSNAIDINNYPILNEFNTKIHPGGKAAEVCYLGGLSRIRGIQEIVQAVGQAQTNVKLNLCGLFNEPDTERLCKALPGWQKIRALGFVDRLGVREVLSRSIAGLVTLHPVTNYLDALPVKMFEYMAAGIPVIASDFPLWREIVVGNECGLCVDPMNPTAIAEAIDYLVRNPHIVHQMGVNGRRAALDKYNWAVEEKKLLQMYTELSNA